MTPNPSPATGTGIAHVHITVETVATAELSPPHPPRVETPTYRKAHQFLVVEKDSPCIVCGVRNSTLHDPAHNPYAAQAVESHHYPIERSLIDAVDPVKVHRDFPEVYDRATLETFADSPRNLLILCDIHHRDTTRGVHHLLAQDFAVQPYLYDGYVVAAQASDAKQDQALDEAIMAVQGIITGAVALTGEHQP